MAGFGESLGWASNPIYKAFDSNRSALVSGFAGLGGASPSNVGGGFAQGFAQGMPMDMHRADRAAEQVSQNATMEWIKANYPQYATLPVEQAADLAFRAEAAKKSGAPGDNLMSVGGHLYDSASGQWISPPETAENRQNVSLTPQWGQDEQGNWVMLQPSSTGALVQSQVPEGVSLVNPFDLNANKAGGTTFGKGIGGAQIDLPGAQLIAEQTIGAINDVRNEKAGMAEHFGNVLGVPQQVIPAWPGTEKAQFQVAADRAINRAFLQGREMLKGGGQITDFESRKAEAAITAAQSALEKGDQAQFLKALDDFEQAVRDGTAKLASQAQVMPGYGSGGGQQAPAAGGYTILGVE